MNITPKQDLHEKIKREYEHLIKHESHEYVVAWVAIKLHVSNEEVLDAIGETA